jgi:hypothetical protein
MMITRMSTSSPLPMYILDLLAANHETFHTLPQAG